MKIENGLLFLSGFSFSEVDAAAVAAANFCVPIRNISHLQQFCHEGKDYTSIHLANGDELIADATISGLIQLITDDGALNLLGYVKGARPMHDVLH